MTPQPSADNGSDNSNGDDDPDADSSSGGGGGGRFVNVDRGMPSQRQRATPRRRPADAPLLRNRREGRESRDEHNAGGSLDEECNKFVKELLKGREQESCARRKKATGPCSIK
eukprot:6213532-Pleurochrysis_carterae.AAC.2